MSFHQELTAKRPAVWMRRILAAWLLAVMAEYSRLPWDLRSLAELRGLAEMSLARIGLLTCAGMAGLWAASRWISPKAERWLVPAAFGALAAESLISSFTWPFLGACILVAAVTVGYGKFGWDCSPEPVAKRERTKPGYLWTVAALGLLFFLLVSIWTVARVRTFSAPTYDFGIFSQMFYHMRKSGLPMTTLERDGLLSHFHVHISPIYYLMLPFYCIAPWPETLQILQGAVMASAVIPLWLLCGKRGLTGWQRTIVCALMLLYPAFSGGAGYDLHENCFLTPLLLWLFYGIEEEKGWLVAVSALLTLMVKEDAAVYVAVIGLWLTVKALMRWQNGDRRCLAMGVGLLTVSIVWFYLATSYLAWVGDGVMTYRYENFMYDGSSSLLTVVKSVLLSPMKAVYECVDPEKLGYLALTMLPLLGLPLATRRYERYILLIPYLLVNLMSDYQYQHSIYFQYSFGSLACLMYLTVVNLADIRRNDSRFLALMLALVVSATCFASTVLPLATAYPAQWARNHGHYAAIRSALAAIPEDASVTASTFYTTCLSQRDTIYDLGYASQEHILSSDYVVIGLSPAREDGAQAALLERNGYQVFAEVEDTLVIYQKPAT